MTPNEVLAPLVALAGERESGSGNNTTVNKFYNAIGAAYCGFSIRYAFEKSGNGKALEKSSNTAYVPTFLNFCKKYWKKIPNAQAQKGDVFIYKDDHEGFVFSPYSGATVITLEGNSMVYATEAQAKASRSGTGAFEGIGYKKRYLSADYQVFRPPYTANDDPLDEVIDVGPEITVKVNKLYVGCSGAQVKTAQRILYARGLKDDEDREIKVDGKFGNKTAQATVRLQKQLFQDNPADWDGVWGFNTWTAALTQLW